MKVLVVGAGIAGAAVGMYLHRQGHQVRIVDAAAEPHAGGYLLQLDRTAQGIARELGLGRLIQDTTLETPQITLLPWRRRRGSIRLSSFRVARRGDFVTAVMQCAAQEVEVELGIALTSLEHVAGGVIARFGDGTQEQFDLIVGADGLRSTVRGLMATNDQPIYKNGHLTVWANLPVEAGSSPRALLGWDKSMTLQMFPYPDGASELALVSVRTPHGQLTPEEGHQTITRAFREWGFNREAEMLAQFDPEGLRIMSFAQARTPAWSSRRVVLVGDAAHCIDPMSGLGAHGAFFGARNLDRALQNTRSLSGALRNYERRTRPFTEMAQRLTAGLLEGLTADRPKHVGIGLKDLARAAIWRTQLRKPDLSKAV